MRGEQWLTSDAPTVLTPDLLWADRLAQNLKSSLIMIKKHFFMPWLKKKSLKCDIISALPLFVIKLIYVWYTCNRCVKQHEHKRDGSGLRYSCSYSYSPFLLVLGEVSKLWHSFNVIKVWIKTHIGSQHRGFSSSPFNGNK